MKRNTCALAVAGVLALAAPSADATTIFPPGAMVAGKSIDDWTAAWWTWAAGLPATGNAFDDPTGALAHQHNGGPVFFVAGYFSLPAGYTQPPVMRSFSVAAGRPILIPLVNLGVFQFSQADETAIISSFNASNLTAIIDNVPVPNLSQYVETTGFFSAGPIRPNTIGSTILATPGFPGVPPDCLPTDLCPGLSTGYWLMLDLSPGVHVIDTGGTASVTFPPDLGGGGLTFTVGTDYTISVVAPEPASALLLLPGLLGIAAIRRRFNAN